MNARGLKYGTLLAYSMSSRAALNCAPARLVDTARWWSWRHMDDGIPVRYREVSLGAPRPYGLIPVAAGYPVVAVDRRGRGRDQARAARMLTDPGYDTPVMGGLLDGQGQLLSDVVAPGLVLRLVERRYFHGRWIEFHDAVKRHRDAADMARRKRNFNNRIDFVAAMRDLTVATGREVDGAAFNQNTREVTLSLDAIGELLVLVRKNEKGE